MSIFTCFVPREANFCHRDLGKAAIASIRSQDSFLNICLVLMSAACELIDLFEEEKNCNVSKLPAWRIISTPSLFIFLWGPDAVKAKMARSKSGPRF